MLMCVVIKTGQKNVSGTYQKREKKMNQTNEDTKTPPRPAAS